MSGWTPGKIVLTIFAILSLIIILFIGVSLALSVSGYAPDSLCTIDASMNSLTPFNTWRIVPNFACHIKEENIGIADKSILKGMFGNEQKCSCNDFFAPNIYSHSDRIADGDLKSSSRIPIVNNVSKIYLSTSETTELNRLKVIFDDSYNFKYSIYTKVKSYFWSTYKECTNGDFSGSELNLSNLKCNIDKGKFGVYIKLYDPDKEVTINETNIFDPNGKKINITKVLFSYRPSNILKKECELDSNMEHTEGCTPKWQKKWTEKKLLDLAIRCWKMGSKGRDRGNFECFYGCVNYNSSEGIINKTSLISALYENYYSNKKDEILPYNDTLPEDNLQISDSKLKDGQCFAMKYYGYKPSRKEYLVGTGWVDVTPGRVAKVKITFGRTKIEARNAL